MHLIKFIYLLDKNELKNSFYVNIIRNISGLKNKGINVIFLL